nr:alkaline phosphatase family protein [Candidatus Freyarchaeota archaeon]
MVIGLDGATWDVLMPLIKENKLPNFKKLIENGAYGSLESTIPPITSPAWISLATGKNPGKLGVYDLLNKEGEELGLKPVFSGCYRGQAVWDYLSMNGYKVGMASYPITYPPYRINGFMISGVGSPIDSKITYPKELEEELDKIFGGYAPIIQFGKPKYDNMELFLRDLNITTDKQFGIVLHLLKTKDWQFFIYVCSATDWIQHKMWKHIDESHPLYDQDTSLKYAEEFEKFFQKIDGFLSQLMNFEANLLIVSDHGFGPLDQFFNLTKWLEKKGYLVKKKTTVGSKVKRKLFQLMLLINRWFKIVRFIPNKLIIKGYKSMLPGYEDLIDYDRSAAYCLGHSINLGGIYINSKIKNSERFKAIKMKIMNDLQGLSNDIKKHVKVTIYEPEKIYNGDKIHLAPDIMFTINDWRCAILEENFDRSLFEDYRSPNRLSGTHRLNGIFLAHGKDIKKGCKIENAKIYDIAPTILHIFDLPMQNDLDGRVLMEIFEPDSEPAKRKPIYVYSCNYNKSEEEKIKAKIKKLKREGKI